jgi:hypothetical protein
MNDIQYTNLLKDDVRSIHYDEAMAIQPPASAILVMAELVGLDRDLEEFEARLALRHSELLAAAARLKDLIATLRQARADPEGKP